MYSIKHQLLKGLLVNMLLVMFLLMIGLNFMILKLITDHASTRLQHDAESLISELARDANGQWTVNVAHLSTIYNRVRSGHYYLVQTRDFSLRSRSLFDFEFEPRAIDEGPGSSYRMDGAGDEEWLVWQQQINKGGADFTIWVAEDLSPIYRDMRHFFVLGLVVVLASTLLALYRQQRIVGASLNVFEQLRRELNAHDYNASLQRRDSIPREVAPLVEEINQLLRFLQQRTQRTRNAIANLAHELKRPLQILSLKCTGDNAGQDSVRAIEDIHGVIERELRRARLSGSDRLGGACDVREEWPHLIDMTARIYPHISVETNGLQDLKPLPYDRGDVLELLGNLLDNACKFANHQVRVQFAENLHEVSLVFEDDGPGVDESQIKDLARPGFRVDESIKGHGLGLGLCADIVDSFNGSLEFGHAMLGGLKVAVSLPLQVREDLGLDAG